MPPGNRAVALSGQPGRQGVHRARHGAGMRLEPRPPGPPHRLAARIVLQQFQRHLHRLPGIGRAQNAAGLDGLDRRLLEIERMRPPMTGTAAAQASIRFCPPSGAKLPATIATSQAA